MAVTKVNSRGDSKDFHVKIDLAMIATGTAAGRVTIHCASTGDIIQSLPFLPNAVFCMCFSSACSPEPLLAVAVFVSRKKCNPHVEYTI